MPDINSEMRWSTEFQIQMVGTWGEWEMFCFVSVRRLSLSYPHNFCSKLNKTERGIFPLWIWLFVKVTNWEACLAASGKKSLMVLERGTGGGSWNLGKFCDSTFLVALLRCFHFVNVFFRLLFSLLLMSCLLARLVASLNRKLVGKGKHGNLAQEKILTEIYLAIETNTIEANTFCNWYKCIFQLRQIYFVIETNKKMKNTFQN